MREMISNRSSPASVPGTWTGRLWPGAQTGVLQAMFLFRPEVVTLPFLVPGTWTCPLRTRGREQLRVDARDDLEEQLALAAVFGDRRAQPLLAFVGQLQVDDA